MKIRNIVKKAIKILTGINLFTAASAVLAQFFEAFHVTFLEMAFALWFFVYTFYIVFAIVDLVILLLLIVAFS